MKKALLVILSLVMVFSTFAATIGVSADDTANAPAFEQVYSNAEIVSSVGLDGDSVTAKEYDATENAMKVYASKDGKAPARFLVKYSSGIKADENPVLAVVVKPNGIINADVSTRTTGSEAAKSAGAKLGVGDSKVSTWGLTKAPVEVVDLADGYKLMIVDIWQSGEIYGKLNDTIYPLVSGSKMVSSYVDLLPYADGSWTYNENDYFFVRSSALFTDKEAAKKYYGADIADYLVFDLDSEVNYADTVTNRQIVANGSAASVAYDSAEGAMYIAPNTAKKEGANVALNLSSLNIDPSFYPYISVKVKLKDSSSVFGQIAGNTRASQTYKSRTGLGSTYNLTTTTTYAATTDWQIITLDVNNVALKTSTASPLENYPLTSHTVWNKINVQFCPYNKVPAETEGYWVEWIGFFKNAEDAALYDNRDNSAAWYGWQRSDADAGEYKVRLLTTVDGNYENYDKAGAVITAVCASGTYDLSMDTTVVFNSVLAMSEGGSLEAVTAPTGRKFVALVINEVPVDEGDITFTVEPYVEKNGARFFGESYTCVISSTK